MKNIHILPTDKPSRFVTSKENKKCYLYSIEEFKNIDKFIEYDSKSWDSQNIYITSDEEIKVGDWFYNSFLNEISKMDVLDYSNFRKKIILTDNKDLIKDGVQSIDDEFLEWFIKNPSCEEVEIINTFDYIKKGYVSHSGYKIQITKEEECKQELERGITITQVEKKTAVEWFENSIKDLIPNDIGSQLKFKNKIEQAKEMENEQKGYSEEEVLNFTQTMIMQYKFGNTNIEQMDLLKETLQLFKNK
jgi:hypothetical protein